MKILTLLALGVAVAAGGLMAWVRLAPSDPARWHGVLSYTKDEDRADAAVRIVPTEDPAGILAELDAIALSAPRTTRLAGSVPEGSVTYISRSAFWGFPDYTTITAAEDRVILLGRLRFGQSDFGVNKKRITDWISQL